MVTTKLKSELKAKQNLELEGVESFFPTYRPKKRGTAGAPLFPRYLFVRCDLERDFECVRFARGVSRFVSFGSQYIPLSEHIIVGLKASCNDQGVIERRGFEVGERVRVVKGAFAGCVGIIQETCEDRRIKLLLEIAYGTQVLVTSSNYIDTTFD